MTALRHGTDLERTIFFSDAVFAIAMTLLVLELRVPESAGDDAHAFAQAVLDQLPAFTAFVLSFVLVGSTWMNHHRRFRAIVGYDARLQALNLLVLLFVAFMPVPSGLLFQPSGDSAIPPILYAATMVGIFASLNAVWRHALRAGLLAPEVGPPLYRFTLTATYPVAAAFLASMPLALIGPTIAELSWVAIWPLSLLGARWRRRRFEREETARLVALDALEALEALEARDEAAEPGTA